MPNLRSRSDRRPVPIVGGLLALVVVAFAAAGPLPTGALAQSPGGGTSPMASGPIHDTVALVDTGDLTSPLAVASITHHQDGSRTTTVSFAHDLSSVAGADVELFAGNPGGETARTAAHLDHGVAATSTPATTPGSLTPAAVPPGTQVPAPSGSRLTLATPALPATVPADQASFWVAVSAPGVPTFTSPLFDWASDTRTAAGLVAPARRGWLQGPGSTRSVGDAGPGPTVSTRGFGFQVSYPGAPPDTIDGSGVTGVVDELRIRPSGVSDVAAPFRLVVDERQGDGVLYRTGDDNPLTSVDGGAGRERRAADAGSVPGPPSSAQRTRTIHVGRPGDASTPINSWAALSRPTGATLDARSIISVTRTITLADGRTLTIDGTEQEGPVTAAETATTTAPSVGTSALSSRQRTLAIAALVVLVGAVAAWILRDSRTWRRCKRRLRRLRKHREA